MTDDDSVRFTVQMTKKLREDAKRNTDRGELSEAIRDIFRQRAYGIAGSAQPSELEQTKAELRDVRQHIDELRHERGQIEAEIEAEERRATRLEERVGTLEEERTAFEKHVEMLENLLLNGERLWPTRIRNAADVDDGTAHEILTELQGRNPEIPARAFEEPGIHESPDWQEEG